MCVGVGRCGVMAGDRRETWRQSWSAGRDPKPRMNNSFTFFTAKRIAVSFPNSLKKLVVLNPIDSVPRERRLYSTVLLNKTTRRESRIPLDRTGSLLRHQLRRPDNNIKTSVVVNLKMAYFFSADATAKRPAFPDLPFIFSQPPHPEWQPGQPQPFPYEDASETFFDAEKTNFQTRYGLMINGIVPRPIALVSTVAADGKTVNVSPYSFFNALSADPPTVMFSGL